MNINALRQAQARIAEAIKALKKTRNEHEEYLKPIETRTRQLLIDPMLEALGWDVRNPAQVHLEYKGTSGKPDYALFSHGNVVALIEAKKLEMPPAHIKVEQVLKYARDRALTSLKYVVWTNGDHWQIWSIEEDREESFQLSNTQEYECAAKVIQLLRSALEVQEQGTSPPPPPRPIPKPVRAQPPIAPSDAGTRETPREMATPVPSSRQEAVEPSNGGQDQDGWMPLTLWEVEAGTRQKPQANTKIKFPDSSTKSLKNWTDLFAFVAEYLVKTGKISARNCPVIKGKSKRHLLHTEPIHPNGRKFLYKREIGNGLWLFTQFSPDKLHENSCWLLENFDVDPSTVLVSTNRS